MSWSLVVLRMPVRQPATKTITRKHADNHSVSRSALRILIVAVPPVRTLDVFGPAEVLGDANWLRGGDPAYNVASIGLRGPRGFESSRHACPDGSDLPGISRADRYALVAGCMDPREVDYETGFLDWLRLQSTGARRFGSICTGAFVLAKAGLLDGRRATTHRNWASELDQDFTSASLPPSAFSSKAPDAGSLTIDAVGFTCRWRKWECT
jgi:transcriptional regulator GlxA family with amidase domain